MTVPGREQFLILETIPTPRHDAPCYEAAHWTVDRSKTPRRLPVPCSVESVAGGHIGWSQSAHAAAAAGPTAEEPFFPLFSPAGPRARSTQPSKSPALHGQQHYARSGSQGGREPAAHTSSNCNRSHQGLGGGKARNEAEADTPFFPLFSINSRPAIASPSPTSAYT